MTIGAPRGTYRTKTLSVSLTSEEYEMILSAGMMEDKRGATWARDVLISRAVSLYRQRMSAA